VLLGELLGNILGKLLGNILSVGDEVMAELATELG